MNRMLAILLLAASAALVGCEVVVTGGGTPYEGVVVHDASYRTDARATIGGVDRFVICDDRVTELTYSFDYEGPLDAWTSYIRGVTSDHVIGRETFRPSSAGVSWDPHHVEVTYAIHAGIAPLGIDGADAGPRPPAPGLGPQAIDVVPVPQVIGYTRLYLELGTSGARQLVSKDIPVLADCSV